MTRPRRPADASASEPIDLTIDRLGAQGDGIATSEGRTIYVPYVLPGERVRARLTGTRGDGSAAMLDAVLTPSPERVEPPCPHFGSCGGCALQHLDAVRYRALKRERIVAALTRAGLGQTPIAAMIGGGPGERRRAVFSAVRRGKRTILGFNRRASHDLVDLTVCPVLEPALAALIAPLRVLLSAVLPDRVSADLVATLSDSGIDLAIRAACALDLARREALAEFAETNDIARLIWQQDNRPAEPVAIRRAPIMRFGGRNVALPSGGFLQATRGGEAAIVTSVLASLPDPGKIADLYAGLGTLTLPIAARGHSVHAVEGDRAAADALTAAARGTAVTVERRDLDRMPLTEAELSDYAAVVLDPPRAGAAAQAVRLAASAVPIVVSVSCAAESFARDAAILVSGGFALVSVTPIDQFLWSPHVEMVGIFRR